MEIKYILLGMMLGIATGLIDATGQPTISFPVTNSMPYPSGQESDHQYTDELPYEDSFSESISVNKDDIDDFEKFKKLKDVIPFLRKESSDDPDSSGIKGYFLPRKNTDDKLQYGGVARVEQERYVNVVAINAKDVSDQNQTDVANAQTDAKHAKKGKKAKKAKEGVVEEGETEEPELSEEEGESPAEVNAETEELPAENPTEEK